MFKKSLLALTVAGLSMGANAATSTLTAGGSGTGSVLGSQVVSSEGASSNVILDFKTPAISITHDIQNPTNYATAAKIRVTLTGASFNAATVLAATLDSIDVDNESEATYPAANILEIDLTKDTGGANTAVITGDDIVLGGLVFTPDSVASGSQVVVKVETLSSIADAVIDTSTAVVANYITELSTTMTKVTKTIDVTDDRYTFLTDSATDTFVIKTKSAATDLSFADASASKQAYTVTGDFSWLDADADGAVDAGVSIKSGANAVTFAADMQSFTFTAANVSTVNAIGANTDTETFTITTDKARVIPTAGYSASYTLNYLNDAAVTKTYTSAAFATGDWLLNGTSVNVPYIPVGFGSLSANIEIANTSGVDGDITLDAVDNNGVAHAATKLSFNATAGSVTKVSEQDLVDAFGLTEGTKLSLNVTVAAPTGISVYPYYRENDVRVSLPTSQYRARNCTTTSTIAVTGAVATTVTAGGMAASGVGLTDGDTLAITGGTNVSTTGGVSTSCAIAQ